MAGTQSNRESLLVGADLQAFDVESITAFDVPYPGCCRQRGMSHRQGLLQAVDNPGVDHPLALDPEPKEPFTGPLLVAIVIARVRCDAVDKGRLRIVNPSRSEVHPAAYRTVPVRPITFAQPDQVAFAATAAKHDAELSRRPLAVAGGRSNAGVRFSNVSENIRWLGSVKPCCVLRWSRGNYVKVGKPEM